MFKKNELDPIRVEYETLSALGMAAELSTNVMPKIAKLADVVSRFWISRYYTELGD